MDALAALRGSIPDAAKDIRRNLLAVMRGDVLTDRQRWGVAVASAIAARNPRLRNAMLADAVRIAATMYAAAVALEMDPAEDSANQASELAAATPTA